MGYAALSPEMTVDGYVQVRETTDGYQLENEYVLVEINESGAVTSLYDKRHSRECIQPGGKGNQFVLFDDDPIKYEAWDVDIYHLEKYQIVGQAHTAEVIEGGPLRASVSFEYTLSPHSTLRQVVSLTAISPRLDFITEVDWHEHRKFLKVVFPFNLRAAFATYEVQYGYLQRPTHFNNSWDMARFEVFAQRWADFSEPDYGVALLNDSKYGYAVHDNVIRLSLLRSPKSPDPQADMGFHTFRYALLPHAGTPIEAGVIETGYCFNVPLLVRSVSEDVGERSFFSVSGGSLFLDTVKKAEDSDAIIVRLYEAHGKRGRSRLESTLPVVSASVCNLLEEDDQPVEWVDGGVEIDFTPFQLITLKLGLG